MMDQRSVPSVTNGRIRATKVRIVRNVTQELQHVLMMTNLGMNSIQRMSEGVRRQK